MRINFKLFGEKRQNKGSNKLGWKLTKRLFLEQMKVYKKKVPMKLGRVIVKANQNSHVAKLYHDLLNYRVKPLTKNQRRNQNRKLRALKA